MEKSGCADVCVIHAASLPLNASKCFKCFKSILQGEERKGGQFVDKQGIFQREVSRSERTWESRQSKLIN